MPRRRLRSVDGKSTTCHEGSRRHEEASAWLSFSARPRRRPPQRREELGSRIWGLFGLAACDFSSECFVLASIYFLNAQLHPSIGSSIRPVLGHFCDSFEVTCSATVVCR